jgi:hypothetical protein
MGIRSQVKESCQKEEEEVLIFYITNVMQLYAVVFILHCEITLHVSGAF